MGYWGPFNRLLSNLGEKPLDLSETQSPIHSTQESKASTPTSSFERFSRFKTEGFQNLG